MENPQAHVQEIGARILQFITCKGLTPHSAGKELGVSSRTMANATKGESISIEIVTQLLAHYPDLNQKWLLTGMGSMMILENEPDYRSTLDGYQSQFHQLLTQQGSTNDHEKAQTGKQVLSLLDELHALHHSLTLSITELQYNHIKKRRLWE